MASEGSTQALIKRRNDELALMSPPPTKRSKRPTEVLDEDDYTEGLSDIIARDYYPGLREAKAQEEYLSALDSKNPDWIREAGRKLQAASKGEIEVKKSRRETRDTRFDTPRSYRQAADTPVNPSGADTPLTTADTEVEDDNDIATDKPNPDTNSHSLSSYQAKYTSEDNASFNTLLDKQNDKRRQKHSYLWGPDQRLLSNRQIEHRKTEQRLLQDKSDYEIANGKALVPLTTGATKDRSAKPASWKLTKPDNNVMFIPSTSVDELGLQTTMQLKESMSKAGPKEIVHANTRFPPTGPRFSADDDDPNDDTTSIHTSFIARRNNHLSTSNTEVDGSETPRVNGYSFVDEDAPSARPQAPSSESTPTYRDLLAGQTASTHNPFKLSESQKREALLHKLVERDAEKKRAKHKEVTVVKGGKEVGNMTPAARKLLGRLGGRTPGPSEGVRTQGGSGSRKEDWTPVATPRRGRVNGVK